MLRHASVLLVCEVLLLFPEYLTARTITVLGYLNAVRMIVFVLAAPSRQSLVDNQQALLAMRVLDVVYVGGHPSMALVHMVVFAAHSGTYIANRAEDTDPTSSTSVFTFVSGELGLTLCVLLIASQIWGCWEKELRATLESKESFQAKETVERLLSVMCDAVIHIDANLHIRGPTPKLSALLLHNQCLDGRYFPELMPAADAERFQGHIAATGHRDHAQILNVKLRDSSGMLVELGLVHTSFRDPMGGPLRHVIGASEVSSNREARRPRQEAVTQVLNNLSGSTLGRPEEGPIDPFLN